MTFEDLEPVVLDVDIPEHGLPKRSLGAVVHVYSRDTYEIEFVAASGKTAAVLTLHSAQLRKATDDDLICVSRIQLPSTSARKPRQARRRR